MQKQKAFYNLRKKSGQFYALKQYKQDRQTERLAATIFLAFMVISAFFEAIASFILN